MTSDELEVSKKVDGDWETDLLYLTGEQMLRDFPPVEDFFKQQMLWQYLQERHKILGTEIQVLKKKTN